MASLNKIMLIGNIGRIETRTFQDGKVVNATLAVSERYKKRDGSQVENTEWFNLVISGNLAEIAEKYVLKGSPIFVEGRLRTRTYTSRDGEERKIQEVLVQSLLLLAKKDDGGQGAQPAPASPATAPAVAQEPEDDGSDLPF